MHGGGVEEKVLVMGEKLLTARKEKKSKEKREREEKRGGSVSCLRDGVLGKVVAEAAHDVDDPGPVVLGLVGHEGRHDGYAEVALRVVGPLLVGLALAGHGALVPLCYSGMKGAMLSLLLSYRIEMCVFQSRLELSSRWEQSLLLIWTSGC